MARYYVTQKISCPKVEIFVFPHSVSQQLQAQIFRSTPEQQYIFPVPQCRFPWQLLIQRQVLVSCPYLPRQPWPCRLHQVGLLKMSLHSARWRQDQCEARAWCAFVSPSVPTDPKLKFGLMLFNVMQSYWYSFLIDITTAIRRSSGSSSVNCS